MATLEKLRVPGAGGSNRLPALFIAGAFIILAGVLAPNLVKLQSLTNPDTPVAEAAPTGGESAAPAPAVGGATVTFSRRMLQSLGIGAAVVVFLGIAAAWMIRLRMRSRSSSGPDPLNVTAVLPLPHRCCVFLLETGDRRFLAGVDANGIQSFLALPSAADDQPAEADPPEYGPQIAGSFASSTNRLG